MRVSPVALEDQEGRWVQQAHEVHQALRGPLHPRAPVALVVLSSLSFHPYQEFPEPRGRLCLQSSQVDRQTLSIL